MSRRRTLVLACVQAVLLMSVVGLTSGTAGADPNPAPEQPGLQGIAPAVVTQMIKEAPLQEYADKLMAINTNTSISTGIDGVSGTVTFYRFGNPSSNETIIIQQATADGYTVNAVRAPFSRATLDDTKARAVSNADATGISLLNDDPSGNGFNAQFLTKQSRDAARQAIYEITNGLRDPQTSPSQYDTLYAPTGTPPIVLSDEVADGAIDFSYGRQNDTKPFFGGGRSNVRNHGCTTGFPMHRGNFADGSHRYLLTAGHCTSYDDSYNYLTPTNLYIGTGSAHRTLFNNNLDGGLINVQPFGAGNAIWDGAWNSTAFNKSVAGDSGTSGNQLLCQSGSYSGTRCALRVKGTTCVIVKVPSTRCLNVIATQQDSLTAAGGQGDSGGPVFSLSCRNNGCVVAHGLVQGGLVQSGYTAPCVGVSTNCSTVLFFTDIKRIESVMGVSIKPE